MLSGCRSSSCVSTECVEQIKTVETKTSKVSFKKALSVNETSLVPGSQRSVSFCENENQKQTQNYCQNINLKPWKILAGAVIIVNV